MRLAFCLYKYFPFGGLQRDFLRIARACQARGHAIRVYALEWTGEVPDGFELVVAPESAVSALSNARRYARFHAWVARDLAGRPADRVIGFNKMPGLDVYFAADPCYEEKARTQRHPLYRLSGRYRHFAACERAVFAPESQTEILMISPVQQPFFEKHYGTPKRRFHLLPPGISRDRRAPPDAAGIRADFRREFALGDDALLLVQIGSGFKTKGLDRSLEALAHLPQALRQRARLIAIGQDDPSPFLRQATSLGIAERVAILPGRADIPRFLLGADLMIHPAYNENTGTVLLEALVAGLPVLTTTVCGYAHYVEEAGGGVVVAEPFVQEKLNGALEQMLSDPAAREKWRMNALRFAETADIYDNAERAADLILGERTQPEKVIGQDQEARHERGEEVVLDEPFRSLWAGRDPFAAAEALDGEVFRELEARRTLRIEAAGRSWFVKIHRGVGWGEIVKNLCCGRAPILDAGSEWRAATRLEQLKVDTLHVVAVGWRGVNPAKRHSFIVTEELAPTISLEDFCRDWPAHPPMTALKRALIRRVADMARRMHEGGVNHRDFYLCHFLLHLNPAPTPERLKLSLIDLHRAQVRRKTPRRWRDKDLAALYFSALDIGLTRRDVFRFLKGYFDRPLRDILRDERARLKTLAGEAERLRERYLRKSASDNRSSQSC